MRSARMVRYSVMKTSLLPYMFTSIEMISAVRWDLDFTVSKKRDSN